MKIKIMRQPEDLHAQTKNKKNKKIKNNKNEKEKEREKSKRRPPRDFEPILTR